MDNLIKIAVLVLVFCAGYTIGQNHFPLDFDGNGHLTRNDINSALQHLRTTK